MGKRMDMEKNIIIYCVIRYMKGHLRMEKEMEEGNFITIIN